MLQQEQKYPSDLTEQQWELIKDILPKARIGGRPRTTDVRQVINAIFYLCRTGCAWRYLPKEFPNWRTVYDYYDQWRSLGIIEQLHSFLVQKVRISQGKSPYPYRCIIDSQASKAHWGEERGYDGFKKVRGRKRNIVVDTLGLIHHLKVDPAGIKDHRSALKMFFDDPLLIKQKFQRTQELYADGGYRGDLAWYLQTNYGIETKLKASQSPKLYVSANSRKLVTSNLKPVRWVVERTFAWFNSYRRLSRDYERTTKGSETLIYTAMIQLMIRRLTCSNKNQKRWNSS